MLRFFNFYVIINGLKALNYCLRVAMALATARLIRVSMNCHVTVSLVAACKCSTTHVADEWTFSTVRAQVSSKVVGAAERPSTDSARERALTSVNSLVTGQLVAARELPRAADKSTRVTARPWSTRRRPRRL